jgi:hypothetical protein
LSVHLRRSGAKPLLHLLMADEARLLEHRLAA